MFKLISFLHIFLLGTFDFGLVGEEFRFSSIEELRQRLESPIYPDSASSVELLNVSYDPTRELYQDINTEFAKWWQTKTGQELSINQSHGGSGKQARTVALGLQADVVTLALALDIDAIASETGWLPEDWAKRLPNESVPFTSTIVFLVRDGNPNNIKDWDDLVRDNVSIIIPNPKTSGAARWIYLAAWGYASKKYQGDETKVKEFMSKLFKNVPTLETGARGATTTFVQRGIGDVLLTWESEAHMAAEELGSKEFQVIWPSLSINAEPPVAWLDSVIKKKGTENASRYYLAFTYLPLSQNIAAKHYYRPIDPQIQEKYKKLFPSIPMLDIRKDFGGWKAAQEKHFKDGGTFDQIYLQR
jgi:sulfate transport system substrate-binding protein